MRLCRCCNSKMDRDMKICPECGAKYIVRDTGIYSADGCPLSVAEQNLILTGDGIRIMLVFFNSGQEIVNAASIKLKCFDQLGDELAETIVKYSDLEIVKGGYFGLDKLFAPTDPDTRKISIIVDKVLLGSGTLYKSNGNSLTFREDYEGIRNGLKNVETSIKQEDDDNEPNPYRGISDRERENKAAEMWAGLEPICSRLLDIKQKLDDIPYFKKTDDWDKINEERKNIRAERDEYIKKYPYFLIPSFVTKIPQFYFENCSTLKGIYIPDSVTEIDKSAFNFCEKLKEVRLSENLSMINESTFFGTHLMSVYITDSVKTISMDAFRNCSKLKEVSLPHDADVKENAFPPATKVIRRESPAQTIERKKRQKAELQSKYWSEHADELQQLISRKAELQKMYDKLEIDIAKINKQLINLRKSLEEPDLEDRTTLAIRNRISKLTDEIDELGVFKVKQRNELKDEIMGLEIKLDSIINDKKEQFEFDVNLRIDTLEHSITPIKSRQDEIQLQIKAIDQKLTQTK